ncbi:MAG: FAD-binding oxidoreductase [Treponema sp.]|jgi:glycine/D-amino acid oxidase-like deaminating enzyme|nr:FAD-binding oxidoreductase [Treponema sp.]
MNCYDTAVIGSGLAGAATAYELTKAGQKVVLIDRAGLSSGSSSANTGLLLYEGGEDEEQLKMCVDGAESYTGLQEELGRETGFSPLPFLSLFTRESERTAAERAAAFYTGHGHDYNLLSSEEVRKRDPLIRADEILGGALFTQWRLDPLKTVFAFFARARELGMDWLPYSPVTGFTSAGGRILAAKTQSGEIHAGQYLVAAGAWTREILSTLNIRLPQYYIHGAAMVLERGAAQIMDHVSSFFTSPRLAMERKASEFICTGGKWENIPEEQANEFLVCSDANGNLLVAQRSLLSPRMSFRIPMEFLKDLCRNVIHWYPSFAGIRVIRSWICPVPFVVDAQAFLGYVHPFENLAVSSGYGSVLIMAPVIGKTGADLLLRRPVLYDIRSWDPNRFEGQDFVK